MVKGKPIGTVNKIGSDYQLNILSKAFYMSVKGYVIVYKPKGFLSKFLWRFIRFEVEYEEAPGLWECLRKVKMPKLKYRITDIK